MTPSRASGAPRRRTWRRMQSRWWKQARLKRDRGGLRSRGQRAGPREGHRGREGAHPDLRGDHHQEARRGRARDLHGPARVVRGGRRADLPAPLPAGRARPGREVRRMSGAPSSTIFGRARERPPGCGRSGRSGPPRAARRPPRATSSAQRALPDPPAPGRPSRGRVPECAGAAPVPSRQGCSSSRRTSTPRSAAPGRGGSGSRVWTRWGAGPWRAPSSPRP